MRRPTQRNGATARLTVALVVCACLVWAVATAPAAYADPPPPFNQCSSDPLPAPSPDDAANTIIVDGQMTAVGQEQNYSTLANPLVTVAFRSVPQPIPTYPGGSFAYPTAANTQVTYWQANDQPFYYTAASSDFIGAGLPLYVAQCDGDAALRMGENRGLYIHELVAYEAAVSGYNWTTGVAAISASDWDTLNYWVELAAAVNKKVIWSEPALGWQALLANATARSYFHQWGATLVPMFATNFDTQNGGYLMGAARQAAVQAASSYGMSLGESVQSWWFRQQTDLGAQESAGLPTSSATGTPPTSCSNSGTTGYELDPLNTDSYSYNSGCYGDPVNSTVAQDELSLNPTASATLALADFGATVGATYFQVEGTNGSYAVAAGTNPEGPVDDMDWSTAGAPSSYLQGIQQLSSRLENGTQPPAQVPTTGLYQLWDAAATSHYYTTAVNTSGVPLEADGVTPAQNCNDSPASAYCYQNTASGATPVPAGYVATSQVNGSVALYQYKKGSQYFYGTGAAPSGFVSQTLVDYVMTSEQPGSEPLYQLYYPGAGAYFYTTDAAFQRPNALSIYQDQGVNSYLFSFPNMPPVPVYSSAPTISGSAVVGQTLSESHGSWSAGPTGYTYRWEDCDAAGANCTPIIGASGQTYVLAARDLGARVLVVERASNSGGLTTTPAASQPTAVVVPPAPVSSAPPTISGSAVVGQTLSESHGSWSNNPTSYAYQWEDCDAAGANCTPIAGASTATYQVAPSDLGETIVVAEAASNAGGAGAAANSTATAVVQNVGLASASAAHAKHGAVRLTVSCAGATSCSVSETLSVIETWRGKRLISVRAARRQPLRRVTIVVGSAAQEIAAGAQLQVSIALNARGRKELAHHHRLAVALSAEQTLGPAQTTVSAQTVRFTVVSRRRGGH